MRYNVNGVRIGLRVRALFNFHYNLKIKRDTVLLIAIFCFKRLYMEPSHEKPDFVDFPEQGTIDINLPSRAW